MNPHTSGNISARLLSDLSDPRPLNAVLKTGALCLGHPLCLVDCTGKILAYSHPSESATDSVWLSFCRRGYVDAATFQALFTTDYASFACDTDLHAVTCSIRQTTMTSLVISGRYHQFARLVILAPLCLLSGNCESLLSTLCRTISLVFEQTLAPCGRTAKELLLYDFLENNAGKSGISERCKISGIRNTGGFQLMTLCNSQNITDLPVFNIARQKLAAVLTEGIFVTHNNRLVVLYTKNRIDRSFARMTGITGLLREYQLTAAVSLPFSDIAHTNQAYIQTLQALDEGLAVDYTDNLYLYQDYLPYHVLSYVKEPKDFCHPCISQLMAGDAVHQTEYTKTLYMYIMNFRNQKDAAQQMNIHYNTMKYRLRKIQSFLDFSLNDHEEFLLLYLSFQLMKLNGHIF